MESKNKLMDVTQNVFKALFLILKNSAKEITKQNIHFFISKKCNKHKKKHF